MMQQKWQDGPNGGVICRTGKVWLARPEGVVGMSRVRSFWHWEDAVTYASGIVQGI